MGVATIHEHREEKAVTLNDTKGAQGCCRVAYTGSAVWDVGGVTLYRTVWCQAVVYAVECGVMLCCTVLCAVLHCVVSSGHVWWDVEWCCLVCDTFRMIYHPVHRCTSFSCQKRFTLNYLKHLCKRKQQH